VSESSTRSAASPDRARRRPHWWLLAGVTAAVLVLDQVTKNWAINALIGHPRDLFWTFRFYLTFNSGIAFSLGPGRGQLVGLVAVVVVGVVLYTQRHDVTVLGAVSRGLIVGGATGNLLDRLFRAHDGFFSGRVVDFIDPGWWPVFNVADSAVVIGCILLILNLLIHGDGSGDERRPGDGDSDRAEERSSPSSSAA
jgi:signal peptidase II